MAIVLAAVCFEAAAATHHLPLLPSGSDAARQGVVRILNHSGEAGDVAVTAIDDSGAAFGPVTLSVEAGQAIEFSSMDLVRCMRCSAAMRCIPSPGVTDLTCGTWSPGTNLGVQGDVPCAAVDPATQSHFR
ncbi:MAG: hypothetical protein OXC31_06765 [Spirochaetaceae bacterium]|nr:hypothetical protein [Spirochaetaceae bacterium]